MGRKYKTSSGRWLLKETRGGWKLTDLRYKKRYGTYPDEGAALKKAYEVTRDEKSRSNSNAQTDTRARGMGTTDKSSGI